MAMGTFILHVDLPLAQESEKIEKKIDTCSVLPHHARLRERTRFAEEAAGAPRTW